MQTPDSTAFVLIDPVDLPTGRAMMRATGEGHAVTGYLARVRENLRKGMEKDARLVAFLREKGIRPEDLEQEAGLVKACRQLALVSDDPEEPAKFDALLERLHQMGRQWTSTICWTASCGA